MSECNYNSYGAWWYCSPEGRILELHEQPFYTERQALSRSIRKGYENLKNKSLEEMVEAISGQAVSGTLSLIETTALGLDRLSDLYLYHHLLRAPASKNPIFDRDVEAIHLLVYAKNPSEIVKIVGTIIGEYIYENLDDQQKNKLNRMLNQRELFIDDNANKYKINEFAYFNGFNEAPTFIENTVVRKLLLSIIIYLITKNAILRLKLFKSKASLKNKKNLSKGWIDITLVLVSSYGFIEKLDRASKRLRALSPELYYRLDNKQLSLTYLFFEEDISPILNIIENKNSHDTYEFLQAFSKLK
ncbi:hypothetical protein I4632_03845 [Proteus mirabilis]|uniref:hypothetical protein n=1 Tax=Proteus TaxID=583 RepID=UPI0018C4E7CE|nr:hypothetical protein [Proteus vulgaris]MBG3079364.1 hypothetical protein [Proteus mirabilis]QPN89593.1 hypothetical protein IM703_17770 [Proteus vulgaris]